MGPAVNLGLMAHNHLKLSSPDKERGFEETELNFILLL